MSKHNFRRDELFGATLKFGRATIDLSDYATTGIRAVTVGPSGIGKTNSGLLMAEQLAAQGWVSTLVCPDGELEALYGKAVASPAALARALERRDRRIVVVSARDAEEFVPYGEEIRRAADVYRKPIFLMVDEAQLFSAPLRRGAGLGGATDLLNDMAQRGRKRSLDMFVTAHRFAGSLHRSIFTTKNLTLIGCQEDPTAWPALAPLFRGSKIGYADLQALAPGEFFCFSRSGLQKVSLQMAEALAKVAPRASAVRPALPTTFSQWDRALRLIPAERLRALTPEVVALLGTIAGVSTQQMLSGSQALADELASR